MKHRTFFVRLSAAFLILSVFLASCAGSGSTSGDVQPVRTDDAAAPAETVDHGALNVSFPVGNTVHPSSSQIR